ncbi:MAG TPA: hypothetical protein VK894_02200 [Jiangellales bacterium]|nr:hypothetical protein [Jiangellales bacterium]
MTDDDAGRRSALAGDLVLLHGDLHNHTMLSDGAGDPGEAFARLRAAGLDVAALTDHSSIPRHHLDRLDPADYPDAEALRLARLAPDSLDGAGWAVTGALADEADAPGAFTAIRGFEWTEPWLGHANVWFSEGYLPVHTPGRIGGLHRWLLDHEADALLGYNHPGREPGRFGGFALEPALVPRMVGVEVFNRYDDYLLDSGPRHGRAPALVECLRAGWRPGLLGVSDEHGRDYGLAGKGRTGLWVTEHSRAGVRECLLARRTFATREVGLRLFASLAGVPMGGALPDPVGPLRMRVDLGGSGLPEGRRVLLQTLGDLGGPEPTVLSVLDADVSEVVELDLDHAGSPWVLLRVADPARPNPQVDVTGAGVAGPVAGRALAYASPWYLDHPSEGRARASLDG